MPVAPKWCSAFTSISLSFSISRTNSMRTHFHLMGELRAAAFAASSSMAPDSSLGPICRTSSFTPIFRFLKTDNRNSQQIFRRQPSITMFAKKLSLFWCKFYWVNRWVQITSIDLPVYTWQPSSYDGKRIGNLTFACSIGFILLIGI